MRRARRIGDAPIDHKRELSKIEMQLDALSLVRTQLRANFQRQMREQDKIEMEIFKTAMKSYTPDTWISDIVGLTGIAKTTISKLVKGHKISDLHLLERDELANYRNLSDRNVEILLALEAKGLCKYMESKLKENPVPIIHNEVKGYFDTPEWQQVFANQRERERLRAENK